MTEEQKQQLEKMMRKKSKVAFEEVEDVEDVESEDEEVDEEIDSDDEEYDLNEDMPQLVDLLTSDEGDNVVEALMKSLLGIQQAVEMNTNQMELLTKEVRNLRKAKS
tara:strand:- start:2349 stop:2669 length:321 start_codon:yes stop_codon:yes gene_type:complete